jgi:hypothetical protein
MTRAARKRPRTSEALGPTGQPCRPTHLNEHVGSVLIGQRLEIRTHPRMDRSVIFADDIRRRRLGRNWSGSGAESGRRQGQGHGGLDEELLVSRLDVERAPLRVEAEPSVRDPRRNGEQVLELIEG